MLEQEKQQSLTMENLEKGLNVSSIATIFANFGHLIN